MELAKIRDEIEQILKLNLVETRQDTILEYIPELKYMIGFEHKHPHHHLNVWEHTLLVLKNLNDSNDLELKMAGLLHDVGKPFSYQDEEVRHFHGHATISNDMCKEILHRLGYPKEFIKNVSYLVLMHDTPIDPHNLDNSYEMIKKLLLLQYADAKAHHPDKIEKRTFFLDAISQQLDEVIRSDER